MKRISEMSTHLQAKAINLGSTRIMAQQFYIACFFHLSHKLIAHSNMKRKVRYKKRKKQEKMGECTNIQPTTHYMQNFKLSCKTSNFY